MTGFGQAEIADERWRVAVAVRSVNHRFLDVVVRMGEEWRSLEPGLRARIAEVATRGRVEARVEIEAVHQEARLEVDREGLMALARATEELVAAGLVERGLTAGDLLRAGEVLRLRTAPPAWGNAEQALAADATAAALADLATTRAAEGDRLAEILAALLTSLEAQADRLAGLRETVRDQIAVGLRRRLEEVLGDSQIPQERLALEAALLVERSDVQEELDRLRAHLRHCQQVLGEGGPVGRRLDFLAQEVQRELNTLGAKCRDLGMIEAVLEAKLICEQLREQVQNVE